MLSACGSGSSNNGGGDGGEVDDGDGGGMNAIDAGGCEATTFAQRMQVTAVPGASASGDVFAAAAPGGGTVVAWMQGGGAHLRLVSAAGDVGADVPVAGSALYGLAVHDDAWAVMVSRGSDELFLVSVTASGGPRFETRLLGAVSHSVAENEWFGPLIREGRLVWTGSEWSAYYTVQRLWGSDGVAHYGDQLRAVSDGGALGGMEWSWGCSHSLDVRLSHNGSALGPVCASDCYPNKGVHFHHTAFIYGDDAADCQGSNTAQLAGSVPVAGGFWAGFSSAQGRPSRDAAVVHVTDAAQVGSIVWLTDGGNVSSFHIAGYAGGLVAGYSQAGGDVLVRLDATGNPVGAVEPAPNAGLAGASDFFVHDAGDVGWATSSGSALSVVRLSTCTD